MSAEHREHFDPDQVTMADPTSPRMNAGKIDDVEKNAHTRVDPKSASKTDVTVDAVWGDVGSDGPNYRNLGWYVRGVDFANMAGSEQLFWRPRLRSDSVFWVWYVE